MMKSHLQIIAFSAASFFLVQPALAQVDLEEEDEEPEELEPSSGQAAEGAESEEASADNQAEGDQTTLSSSDQASSDASATVQYYLGARYRLGVTPKFLINAFGVDGGRTIAVNSGGAEFGMSYKGSFDLSISPWIADYSVKETPFKGKKDSDEAWEIIESKLKVFYLSVDFDARLALTKSLDFTYGGGAGIGFVFGELNRQEAYNINPAGVTDPNEDLRPCIGPGNPNAVECPTDGEYGPSDKWPVYPWLTGQVGLRYQPTEHFIGRFLVGLGSTGVWFGLGADYGI